MYTCSIQYSIQSYSNTDSSDCALQLRCGLLMKRNEVWDPFVAEKYICMGILMSYTSVFRCVLHMCSEWRLYWIGRHFRSPILYKYALSQSGGFGANIKVYILFIFRFIFVSCFASIVYFRMRQSKESQFKMGFHTTVWHIVLFLLLKESK